MKKRMSTIRNRMLSLFMVLAMVFTMLPEAALAADEDGNSAVEHSCLVEYADGTQKSFGLEELWAEAKTHIEDENDEVTIDGLKTTWGEYKSALALQDLTDLADEGVIGSYDLMDDEHRPYVTSLMNAMGVSSGEEVTGFATESGKGKLLGASAKKYIIPEKTGDKYRNSTDYITDRMKQESLVKDYHQTPPYDNPNILYSLEDGEGAEGWITVSNQNRFYFSYDTDDIAYPDTDGKAQVSVKFVTGEISQNKKSDFQFYSYSSIIVSRVYGSSDLEAKVNYTIYHANGDDPTTGTIILPAGSNSQKEIIYPNYCNEIDLKGDVAVITAGENTVINRSRRAQTDSDSYALYNWKNYTGDIFFSFINTYSGEAGTDASEVVKPNVIIPGGG